jgi:GNAT superfamily N-acetyltransferase
MRRAGRLIGFVNVAWDGGVHAFLLDTMVVADERRQGHAVRMIRFAAEKTKDAGCEWLHVDFEPHLKRFYIDACGFHSTDAGLIALK